MAMTSQMKAEPLSAAAVLQHWVPGNHIPAFLKNISAVHFIFFFWGGGYVVQKSGVHFENLEYKI